LKHVMSRPERLPLFSIVTPVYNTPLDVLRDTIESVKVQTFTNWEWILVDDASTDQRVLDVLRSAAQEDSRIKLIERAMNGHIVAASNDGLAAANGEFIALLDHDDLLTPNALHVMAEAISQTPDVDYLYSDEDKLGADGEFYDEFRKPDWSPERLRNQMYTSHLGVLRRRLVEDVGGFHEGFDGSQDHDLVLRVTERARHVVHVPETLYHWRVVPGSAAGDEDAKPYAWHAGKRAVQAHLDRMGVPAQAELGSRPGQIKVIRNSLPSDTPVSVVIPTRGESGTVWGSRRVFVSETVRSLLRNGGHVNLEVVVVFDVSTPQYVLEQLKDIADNRLLLVPYRKPFNFSEKCNIGVLRSTSNYIILLNDDMHISGTDFISKLVTPLTEVGVGMTGARLLFHDSTIQHAGVHIDNGHYSHVYRSIPNGDPGYFGILDTDHEVTAVTGACIAIRRDTFMKVGGLSQQLPFNFNDVDLCNKVRMLGLRILWISDAIAFHFESQTRDPVVDKWEQDIIRTRWPMPDVDPYRPLPA